MLFPNEKKKPKQIKMKPSVQKILDKIKSTMYPFVQSSISDDDILEELILRVGDALGLIPIEAINPPTQPIQQAQPSFELKDDLYLAEEFVPQENTFNDKVLPGI